MPPVFRVILLVGLLVWGGAPVQPADPEKSQPLPLPVMRALAAAGLPAGSVSIVVQDVAASKPLLNWNADVSRNPASLMKLVTTYSALMAFGPANRWETKALGEVDGQGLVSGNLYVQGGGDPGLTLESWETLLRDLRIRGVKTIRGNLVLDESRFQPLADDPDSFDHQAFRTYNTLPEALQVGLKAITLTLVPGNGSLQVFPDFDFPELSIDNRLVTRPGACPGDWKSGWKRHVEDDGRLARIVLEGQYPESCGEKTLSYSIFTNDRYILYAFRKIWSELGGTFTGTVEEGTAPAGLTMLAHSLSLPLADQIRNINKYSNNLMARTLFLDMGWEEGKPATTESSARRVRQVLKDQGLEFGELNLENGSGLSRHERITAAHLNALLVSAARQPYQAEFISSLPLLGMDGTTDNRLQQELGGRFHLKTGSLEGVSAIAGYGYTRTGRLVTLVFLANHPRAVASRAAQDALLHWVDLMR